MKNKIVGYWLLLGAFLVIAMVILGGYTRLSHSGLSMVTWKPATGFIPPSTDAQWQLEFTKYQTSPEYKKHNYHFTLDEFKTIYWPEFLHRVLGRVLGLVFLIPFLIFLKMKYLTDRKLIVNVFVIFVLGGLQGLIGWYMVKSGLVDIPSVSHYRLALHFSTALILYVYIVYTALSLFFPDFKNNLTKLHLTKSLWILLVITSLQIIYGAFVAGLKAGLIYPTYPMMGNEWLPSVIGETLGVDGVMSFFEFPVLVQFIHRWLAVVVVGVIAWIYIKTRKQHLAGEQKNVVFSLVIMVVIQFLLGVFTLINKVPISLGVLHQLGAVFLLTCIVCSMLFFSKNR